MVLDEDETVRTLDLGSAVGPQIYRILKKRIIHNDMKPGSRVSESEIGAEYKISRQPVREAFIKLSEEGLVEIRPQRGTFVRKIATSEVMDARFVREAIESDIVRLLAETANAQTIARLRAELKGQREAMDDPDRFMELDDRFHAVLAAAVGKARVWNVVEGLKSQMDRVRHLSVLQFPASKLVVQHEEIIESIAAGDVSRAEAAIRSHLREILNDLPSIAEGNPEFFED